MKKLFSFRAILLLNICVIILCHIYAQHRPGKTDNYSNKEFRKNTADLIATWDKDKSVYVNDIHGIKWSLPQHLEWIERPIVGESTIFKMRNDDYFILLSINVDNAGGRNLDAWENIDKYKTPEFIREMREMARLQETEYINSKVIKELISGIHTNKIITEYKITQPDYPDGVYRLAYQYQLGNGEYIYTFNITGLYLLKTEYGDFDKIANDIIKGLVISKL